MIKLENHQNRVYFQYDITMTCLQVMMSVQVTFSRIVLIDQIDPVSYRGMMQNDTTAHVLWANQWKHFGGMRQVSNLNKISWNLGCSQSKSHSKNENTLKSSTDWPPSDPDRKGAKAPLSQAKIAAGRVWVQAKDALGRAGGRVRWGGK